MEKKTNGILDVRKLACYIKCSFFEKYQKEISPVKLQKALYFCFAYWGGFIAKGRGTIEEIKQSSYLYDATFEAWIYGPVIPLIYYELQENNLNEVVTEDELFKDNDFLKETINSLLDDVFETSDFNLIEAAQTDKCWISSFDVNDTEHNKIINCDDIINEYAFKY